MKEPKPFLQHILDSVERIETYVKDVTYEDFVKDEMRQDAVVRQLEIIGEASARLEKDFYQKYSDIPWVEMKALRNKLVHEYWDLNLEIVWTTATQDLPQLKKQLLPLLKS